MGVTGASRGIGKGIATALTSQGSKVYITGRSGETLLKTAAELGKNAIPVVCDHSKDDEIEKLFEQIKAESGKLDMLANNCFAGGNRLLKLEGDGDNLGKFWRNDPKIDKKAGRVVWVYDIAREQDIREVDGSVVPSHRSVRSILQMVGATEFPDYPFIQKVANFFPRWLVVPKVFYDVGAWIKSNKF